MLQEQSKVFVNADPFRVSDYVNQHVGSHCIRLPKRGTGAASLSHRSFGSLDLCRISYGSSVRVTSPGLMTCYHLQMLLKGHCLWRNHGQEHYFTPGELLLINPDDPADLTYSDECEKFIIKLPLAELDRACSENQWRKPAGGIRFASRHDLQQLDGFSTLLSLTCDEAERSNGNPRVQEHFIGIIVSKLLDLLSNNVERQACIDGGAPFERVSQFIEDNIKHNISLEQLAEVANMSPRSLYNLFERYVGVTPMSYIRKRKLECIHAYLSTPKRQVRKITEVALDYGFLHLGRFADHYRSTFGELPSDTLRRREN